MQSIDDVILIVNRSVFGLRTHGSSASRDEFARRKEIWEMRPQDLQHNNRND